MSTSGLANPVPGRGAELLAVGQQCSAPTCNLVDFLPLKCQHCSKPFCGDHFLPLVHKCEKYDESKYNRVAPSCPLCNTPVSIPVGQDPNLRMEHHIATECSVMTGKQKGSSVPKCAKPKCEKLLFAPIQCGDCKQQFCPSHRFPKDHTCVTVPSAKASKASSSGGSAVAAIKRAVQPSQAGSSATRPPPLQPAPPTKTSRSSVPVPRSPVKVAASASNSSASSQKPNLFSKTDRALVLPTTLNTNAHLHDPPKYCIPKSPSRNNTRSFAPPPLFGFA